MEAMASKQQFSSEHLMGCSCFLKKTLNNENKEYLDEENVYDTSLQLILRKMLLYKVAIFITSL